MKSRVSVEVIIAGEDLWSIGRSGIVRGIVRMSVWVRGFFRGFGWFLSGGRGRFVLGIGVFFRVGVIFFKLEGYWIEVVYYVCKFRSEFV